MSVHDAEPGDIYADEAGKLWRIVGVCREPTVIAEEVEGTLYDPNAPLPAVTVFAQAQTQFSPFHRAPRIDKARKSGGMGGLMWQGWQRIFRRSNETPEDRARRAGE